MTAEPFFPAIHEVAVIAMHGVIPFDLATACMTFAHIYPPGRPEPYRVRVCGEARDVKAGSYDLCVGGTLDDVAVARTVIVPGIADLTAPISERVIATVRTAAARGSRVASICTGAFILAEAGLLDGCRATTHWAAAKELARRYPRVRVDADVLFVDEGRVLTSAGAAAGLDLCLHLIARDLGNAAAASAARLAVMPIRRDGGQAQFIVPDPTAMHSELGPLLAWMDEHAHRALTLNEIAAHASTSVRTLSRRFKASTGTTPAQWMLEARIRRARNLLETTDWPVERIANEAGFDSASSLRESFGKRLGTTPSAYRRALGAAG